MTQQYEILLGELRSVASKWGKRNDVLQSILTALGTIQSMNLAVDYVEWYLPRFEEKYPDESWARKRLKQVKTVVAQGQKDDDEWKEIFPEYYNRYSDPLSRTFQSAIYNLWCMVRSMYHPAKCADYSRGAIATVLTIIFYEYPEWIPAEYIKLGEQPNHQELDRKLWLDLADKLEKLFQKRSSSNDKPQESSP